MDTTSKQQYLKPAIEEVWGIHLEMCPICKSIFFWNVEQCPGCGQLIDWGGAENEI